MVDIQMMINIVVIVLIGYVSIVLLSNIGGIADCTSIRGSTVGGDLNSTLGDACDSFFNNSAVLFSIIGVVILLLVIPIIRGVIGGGGR
jgi:hypothetical protein